MLRRMLEYNSSFEDLIEAPVTEGSDKGFTSCGKKHHCHEISYVSATI
jgi:hypothetical protein